MTELQMYVMVVGLMIAVMVAIGFITAGLPGAVTLGALGVFGAAVVYFVVG